MERVQTRHYTLLINEWLILYILGPDSKARGANQHELQDGDTDIHILERIKGILPELGARGEIANEEAHRVATERVLQYSSELRVAVRDATLGRTAGQYRECASHIRGKGRTAPWLRA